MDRAIAHLLALGFVGALTAAVGSGCSSSSTKGCDSSKCAPNNACVPETDPLTKVTTTECRRLCTSLTDATTGCPANYTCSPDPAGQTYCAKNTVAYAPAKGQWGDVCNPSKGFDKNTDCDQVGGFWCYGANPTDGNAYCTQFDCTDDRQCGAGFYCGTINRYPSVVTLTPGAVGDVQRVCLKREYCAPCRTDLDCLPVNNLPSHCIAGADGVPVCANECTSDKGCNTEAACTALTGLTPQVCFPRAGVCVGDGGLCAPCRSDADCKKGGDAGGGVQGACVRGEFNTEHSCALPAAVPACFDSSGTAVKGACAGLVSEAPAPSTVGCYGGTDFKEVPANYCHGVVPFNGSATPGCYSPKR